MMNFAKNKKRVTKDDAIALARNHMLDLGYYDWEDLPLDAIYQFFRWHVKPTWRNPTPWVNISTKAGDVLQSYIRRPIIQGTWTNDFKYDQQIENMNQYREFKDSKYRNLFLQYIRICKKVHDLGGVTTDVKITFPMHEQDILHQERKLGFSFPEPIRAILQELPRQISFKWWLSTAHRKLDTKSCRIAYEGGFDWNLSNLQKLERYRQIGLNKGYPWSKYFFFAQDTIFSEEVPSGFFALDLSSNPSPVHFVHDGYYTNTKGMPINCRGETINQSIISKDLVSFIQEWSRLGCPGPDCFHWIKFINRDTGYIDSNTENSQKWLQMIGLNSP